MSQGMLAKKSVGCRGLCREKLFIWAVTGGLFDRCSLNKSYV